MSNLRNTVKFKQRLSSHFRRPFAVAYSSQLNLHLFSIYLLFQLCLLKIIFRSLYLLLRKVLTREKESYSQKPDFGVKNIVPFIAQLAMNYRKTNEHKRLNFLVGSPLIYHILTIYTYILGVGISYIIHIYNLITRTFQVGRLRNVFT